MTIRSTKSAILAGWLLTLVAIAISVDVSSVRGWGVLMAVGLAPPVLLTRLRTATDPSMSEVIQKALGR
jgi:hypothetical protein